MTKKVYDIKVGDQIRVISESDVCCAEGVFLGYSNSGKLVLLVKKSIAGLVGYCKSVIASLENIVLVGNWSSCCQQIN